MKSSFGVARKRHVLAILGGEKGATSIEYAILASLIAAVIAVVVANLGSKVQLLFQSVTTGW